MTALGSTTIIRPGTALGAMSRQEQIERCKREAEACRSAGENPNLTDAQKLGAIQGEVDWLVALQIAEEE
jgi:hypothetical protein